MQSKAVFFDRDDTLIIDSDYMHKIEDFRPFADTFEALKEIQNKGYKLFIVTNQSGIGRGFFTEEQMHKFNQYMLQSFHREGIDITDLAFCPHAPEQNCDCRKPSPKLLLELIKKYNIDPKKSYMLGDKISDAQAGINAGLTGVLLKKEVPGLQTFQSLTEFAHFLQ